MDTEITQSMGMSSDSASAEFHDAEEEADFFQEAVKETADKKYSLISELRAELEPSGSQVTDKTLDVHVDKNLSASMESLSLEGAVGGVAATTTPQTPTTSATTTTTSSGYVLDNETDYLKDPVWCGQRKHIFVLSKAGKPIYSLHGSEDKLATLFGIIQALVSFVQHGEDELSSIEAEGIRFVFLHRNSLILAAASRTNMSVPQLQMQLNDVYNQILSTLTYQHMNTIFEKRKNFDLRRLLAGSERLIHNLLANDTSNKKVTNNVFTFVTNSIRVLPLALSIRSNIASVIQSNCSKIKNLVFAVLIADNKLISLVRMKKYSIHPADLRLIFNLIECSESFKASENWTPICLPKFDMNGFLHAHVSYLTEDCPACLLLLSVDRDSFFTLSEAKKKITEKLAKTNCLTAINDELKKHAAERINLNAMGLTEIRHFIYKPKSIAQLLCSEFVPPFNTLKEFEHMEAIYYDMLHRVHDSTRPLKLIYECKEREVILGWSTAAYEVYAIFEPFVEKEELIKYIDKLIKWIEKEQDIFFIRNHPTF